MNDDLPSIEPAASWEQVIDQLTGRAVMVVGGPGSGKTYLAQHLAKRLAGGGRITAMISADMGQPLVGVPTCLGLALGEPWNPPAALWFVGDVSPRGNLLPAVVGTSRLVQRARQQGAQSVVIDTTGLVTGPIANVLKYHKALAAGVDCAIAIQQDEELEQMLVLLGGIVPTVYRCRPSPEANDRHPLERKAYREERYREHFRRARLVALDPACLVGCDWAPICPQGPSGPARGTLVGLLDREGFCLGLGLVEEMDSGRLIVFTPQSNVEAVARVQIGRMRLNRRAGFSEAR